METFLVRKAENIRARIDSIRVGSDHDWSADGIGAQITEANSFPTAEAEKTIIESQIDKYDSKTNEKCCPDSEIVELAI